MSSTTNPTERTEKDSLKSSATQKRKPFEQMPPLSDEVRTRIVTGQLRSQRHKRRNRQRATFAVSLCVAGLLLLVPVVRFHTHATTWLRVAQVASMVATTASAISLVAGRSLLSMNLDHMAGALRRANLMQQACTATAALALATTSVGAGVAAANSYRAAYEPDEEQLDQTLQPTFDLMVPYTLTLEPSTAEAQSEGIRKQMDFKFMLSFKKGEAGYCLQMEQCTTELPSPQDETSSKQ